MAHRVAPTRRRQKKKRNDDEDSETDALHIGHMLVRVEEFQPDRLKLAAKLEPAMQAAWLSPEKLTAHAEVQTLFGIAAADRRVTAKMRVAPGVPHFEQWPGWTFGLPKHERFEQREVELGEVKTDEEGRAQFALSLDAYAAPLLRVAVDLEAFEADGGRGVRGALGTLVSRQPFLIGFKAAGDFDFIPRDVPRAFQLVAIGADAKPAAAPALKRVLIETRHTSVLTKEKNGTLSYVSREMDKEIETADGSLPASATTVNLPVNRAGRFRYEWRDAAGTVFCTVPFTVVGAGESARNLERDTELEITLPDKAWKPGEQLEVSLRAPYRRGPHHDRARPCARRAVVPQRHRIERATHHRARRHRGRRVCECRVRARARLAGNFLQSAQHRRRAVPRGE